MFRGGSKATMKTLPVTIQSELRYYSISNLSRRRQSQDQLNGIEYGSKEERWHSQQGQLLFCARTACAATASRSSTAIFTAAGHSWHTRCSPSLTCTDELEDIGFIQKDCDVENFVVQQSELYMASAIIIQRKSNCLRHRFIGPAIGTINIFCWIAETDSATCTLPEIASAFADCHNATVSIEVKLVSEFLLWEEIDPAKTTRLGKGRLSRCISRAIEAPSATG